MKKIVVLMLSLVASTASFASSSIMPASTLSAVASSSHPVMTPDHKIKLYVQPQPMKGQLAIQDANGQAVYSQTVALHKGLHQQFDVSSLGTGIFRLTLTTGQQTLTKTFVIQSSPNRSFVVQ